MGLFLNEYLTKKCQATLKEKKEEGTVVKLLGM
jgi:hypothetical protein